MSERQIKLINDISQELPTMSEFDQGRLVGFLQGVSAGGKRDERTDDKAGREAVPAATE